MRSDRPAPGEPGAIQHILFDLDNTLLDGEAGFIRFFRELYHTGGHMRRTHTEEEAIALMVTYDSRHVGGGNRLNGLFSDIMNQWPGVFQDLEEAMQVYLTTIPRMLILDPPTRELLEDLQEKGIPSAIVTNGRAILQANKIHESGLDGLVQAFVISEELGIAKPDRRIFERALEQIEASPLTTMFVGDDIKEDILGAKCLGMQTAWVHRGRQWPHEGQNPDHVVGHVSEIRDIVFG